MVGFGRTWEIFSSNLLCLVTFFEQDKDRDLQKVTSKVIEISIFRAANL